MKIPVLSYHSIDNSNSSISLKTDIFEKQLNYLKQRGYKTIDFN